MILVTLGTQKQPFNRLLKYVEEANINEEIIVQSGSTDFSSQKMKFIPMMSYQEMEELIKEARIVITHGGTGSIIMPLQNHKKVIVCARLAKYGEHVDNHQEEIVNVFAEQGYILKLDEDTKLDDLLKNIQKVKINKYESNTKNFIKALENKIDAN